MTQKKTLLFLGTGTSQGIPIIGCDCEQCTSTDSKDRRLRTSALLQYKGKNILFDTGADFREQMLRENIRSIDFVLFTHEHRDHTAGLDELRPLTWHREEPIPIFAEDRVFTYLNASFPHIMQKDAYPGATKISKNTIDETPFTLEGIGEVVPIRMLHFENLPILGFRIEDFAYLTDCKKIDEENLNKLKGVKVLVINALGRSEHPSHLSLAQALDIVNYLKPKQAYFTHIGHRMGLYREVMQELPKGTALAYDGLKIVF